MWSRTLIGFEKLWTFITLDKTKMYKIKKKLSIFQKYLYFRDSNLSRFAENSMLLQKPSQFIILLSVTRLSYVQTQPEYQSKTSEYSVSDGSQQMHAVLLCKSSMIPERQPVTVSAHSSVPHHTRDPDQLQRSSALANDRSLQVEVTLSDWLLN